MVPYVFFDLVPDAHNILRDSFGRPLCRVRRLPFQTKVEFIANLLEAADEKARARACENSSRKLVFFFLLHVCIPWTLSRRPRGAKGLMRGVWFRVGRSCLFMRPLNTTAAPVPPAPVCSLGSQSTTSTPHVRGKVTISIFGHMLCDSLLFSRVFPPSYLKQVV